MEITAATPPANLPQPSAPECPSMPTSQPGFEVEFWGVRGSIPTPGKDTVRYGGNTSCVEMRAGGKRLIFDGGTGIRLLGRSLTDTEALTAYLFFTHYHWDHIQGVPLFEPLFKEGNCFHIHGAVTPDAGSMEEHFNDRILHLGRSPVPLPQLRADLKFHDLAHGEAFQIGDVHIELGDLNHPNGAIGYRVTWQGKTVVYCTDTEHLPDRLDENVLTLARDADILIYDAMYTDEEYHNPKSPKVGWGHSTWQEGFKVAKAANVKQLVVFHHEPNHSDDMLDGIAAELGELCEHSCLAYEGLVLTLD